MCCENRAKSLIVASCGTNLEGEYIARELAQEQTIDNLHAFGERLAEREKQMRPCQNNCEEA